MTAAERMTVGGALGPDVLAIAERLEGDRGAPTAPLYRDLLETLYRQHADVMSTPLGIRFSVAVVKRVLRVPIPKQLLVQPASRTRSGTDESSLTDLYIAQGQIGQRQLSSACYTWHKTLRLAAIELWRRGEADAARVMLKAGRTPVRRFLRERFGIVTGVREYWHRENWTPDRADLNEFLAALREAKTRTCGG